MEVNEHDIEALITQSAGGDAKSFQKIYDHLAGKVYAYLSYRTSTKEQATDLTQDVFIDLFTALSSFEYKSRSQFYAFVFVIARRKLARHYTESTLKKTNETSEFDEAVVSDSTLDILENQGKKFDIEAALNQLEPQTREIIILHHWSRHTFGEIAQIMDMGESAVRVRHHRALKELASKLNK